MPKEFSRTERLGEQLQRELAELIRDELKDPRLGLVTVTAVEISRDLSHAKVFVTEMLDGKRQESIKALRSSAGFLRREIGRRLSVRMIPELHFHYDESVEEGARMDRLIDQAIASDRHEDD
ncbi:MAG: 30S ribosome-binding factor RbfA [Gammaproteobacteria bacterium]|nr:30S ribosome-binding factor RbfA [Gammaproteobacteria bacterium]